jgi:hypothetical protein
VVVVVLLPSKNTREGRIEREREREREKFTLKILVIC